MAATTHPRWPLDPLAKHLGYGDIIATRTILSPAQAEARTAFCEQIDLDPKRLAWMIDPRNPNGGLDGWEADRAAIRNKLHPRQIWPDWHMWIPDDGDGE